MESASADCRYTETHEWFRLEGDIVTMGITQFAADELTDITFVELPGVGTNVTAGQPCGEIESVKATSDLISAVSGEVVASNDALADAPELVNSDPIGDGWMIKIRVEDLSPLDDLMDAAAYNKVITSA
jgi:glycine cleavage system H protein